MINLSDGPTSQCIQDPVAGLTDRGQLAVDSTQNTENPIAALGQEALQPGPTIRDPQKELAIAFAKCGHLAAAGTTLPFRAEHPERVPVTLATMPRWLEIHFPRRLRREIGRDGIAIPTYKIFEWVTESSSPIRAEYYGRLAELLQMDVGSPPRVESAFDYLLGRLTNMLRTADWASLGEVAVSAEATDYLNWYADIIRRDLLESFYPRVEVSLPEDILPMGTNDVPNGHGMCISTGQVLAYIAAEIDTKNPVFAALLRRAVEAYYPDDELQIEVTTPTGDSFWLHSLCSEEHPRYQGNPGKLEYVPGSIDVVNYEHASRYSRYDHELPYRIFRFWNDEDEEMCLLISEDLVLQATVARD